MAEPGRAAAPDRRAVTGEARSRRVAGTSYAAIAKAEGVSESDLIAKTVEIEKDELNAAVGDSTLTDAQRTSYLSSLESNIKTAIASTDAMSGPGGPGGHGPQDGTGAQSSGTTSSSTTTQ